MGSEFKIYESLEDVEHKDLPTLIVGCEFTKENFGKLNFMDRKVADNIFWTFTKKEMRKYYHNDLEDFVQHSFENSVKKLHYIYFDLIQFEKSKIKKITKKLFSLENVYSFHINNMVYIYSENCIFGLDLELFSFVGFKPQRIVEKIKSRSTVFLEGNEILIEYKNYMERLENKAKYIPFIYSISNYE